jgi:hypothetical protein
MKTRKLAFALAISVISLLSGCGSNGGSAAAPTSNIIGYTTQCTASGCVQVPIYGNSGGCVPLTYNTISNIYFAGTGQLLGPYVLGAGTIPNYGSYGALSISNTPVSTGGGTTWTSPSGLTINIANSNYNGATTSVSGSLQLSVAAVNNILYSTQYGSYTNYSGAWGSSFYGSGYGSGYGNSSACVSGLALQLAPYSSVNGVYGYAYLYLNNTQHGYILQLY